MTTLSDHQCPEFRRYMKEFRGRLRRALDENKWFLSERQGRDVGEKQATEDFLQNHFDRFAEEIRTAFCEHQCSLQKNCPLAVFTRSLPATAKALEKHAGKGAAEKPETTASRS